MEVMSTNTIEITARSNSGEVNKEYILGRMMQLQLRLEKKKEALSRAQLKLARAKKNIGRLKGIVTYQRERIVQLQLNHAMR
jgi:hypothetical protein